MSLNEASLNELLLYYNLNHLFKKQNQNDIQIINSAARILECVIPLLQSPSNSFLISLEESLCKLIFQGGMMVNKQKKNNYLIFIIFILKNFSIISYN